MFLFVFFSFSLSNPVIIPYPNHLTVHPGQFTLTSSCQIGYNPTIPSALEIASLAASQLRPPTGFTLPLIPTRPSSGIYFALTPTASNSSYCLNFTAKIALISAAHRSGLFYGFQTLLQLLPPLILLTEPIGETWSTPNVSITDSPRFPWRGIHIDVSRHFHPISTLKSLIRSMSRFKLNTLHLHLTDDQGWRIESKRYPLLTTVGSVRDSSPLPWRRHEDDGIPYGPYFFTQDEMRDLVSYAHRFEIRIVPEIEMPGHCLASLAAYPQYSCTGGPFEPLDYWGGVADVYCPGNNATFEFLQNLLDELFAIFDSPFIHIGGDECSHKRWAACPKCQARMKSLGLPDTDALQSWFIGQIAKFISSRGRRLVGWDEILEGGLPDGTTVMSWTGRSGGIDAAKLGHEVVMTPQQDIYLDRYQFANDDGYEYFGSLVTVRHIYGYNVTDGFDQQWARYVIGVQGNLWTEYVWAKDDLEWKLFPRSAAVAEIGWTKDENQNWGRFLSGLANVELNRLKLLGINCAPLASGVAVNWSPGEIPSRWVTMQWGLTGVLGVAMKYEIAFVWMGGVNELRINRVRLYIAGTLAGNDNHEGVAGPVSRDNIYSVTTKVDATNAKVYLMANVTCDGGSDCRGSVFAYGT